MRKAMTLVVAASLLLMIFSGLQTSLADQSEDGSLQIGVYQRLGSDNQLNANHVTVKEGGLEIKGPVFTSKLHVAQDYLDSSLGSGWSASSAFTFEGGHAVFESRKAEFAPLELGSQAVFTMGSREEIEFQDRPMWVSVHQETEEGSLTVHMEDGDTTGQSIYIARQWLEDLGIPTPNVVHEDGTNLTSIATADGLGFEIQMPHFSYIRIGGAIDVRGKIGSSWVDPHPGERRWDNQAKILEIDVAAGLTTYEVWIEKPWLDDMLPWFDLQDYEWSVESIASESFVVVSLPPREMTTTLTVGSLLSPECVNDLRAMRTYSQSNGWNESTVSMLGGFYDGCLSIEAGGVVDTPDPMCLWTDLEGNCQPGSSVSPPGLEAEAELLSVEIGEPTCEANMWFGGSSSELVPSLEGTFLNTDGTPIPIIAIITLIIAAITLGVAITALIIQIMDRDPSDDHGPLNWEWSCTAEATITGTGRGNVFREVRIEGRDTDVGSPWADITAAPCFYDGITVGECIEPATAVVTATATNSGVENYPYSGELEELSELCVNSDTIRVENRATIDTLGVLFEPTYDTLSGDECIDVEIPWEDTTSLQ